MSNVFGVATDYLLKDEMEELPKTATAETALKGEKVTVTATPEKEGYEFLGWKKGSVAVDAKGDWTIDEDNVTLKATWKEIKPDDENDDKYWTDNY